MIIYGKHCVLAALESGRMIHQVYLGEFLKSSELHRVEKSCHLRKIPLEKRDRNQLFQICKSTEHQGYSCEIPPFHYLDANELTSQKGDKSPLILFLDGIQDPGNLGSIIRTSVGLGHLDIVCPKNRCAPITSGVFKSSVGTIEKGRIYQTSNLSNLARRLKKEGYWFYGAESAEFCLSRGGVSSFDFSPNFPAVLIIGAEQKGIARPLLDLCDQLIHIPLLNQVESFNAAQSFAILGHIFQKAIHQVGGKG